MGRRTLPPATDKQRFQAQFHPFLCDTHDSALTQVSWEGRGGPPPLTQGRGGRGQWQRWLQIRVLGLPPSPWPHNRSYRNLAPFAMGRHLSKEGFCSKPREVGDQEGVCQGAEATAKVTFRKPVSSSQGLSSGLSRLFVLGGLLSIFYLEIGSPGRSPAAHQQATHLGDRGTREAEGPARRRSRVRSLRCV